MTMDNIFLFYFQPEESATKICNDNVIFEESNFEKCKTRVTDKIDDIDVEVSLNKSH